MFWPTADRVVRDLDLAGQRVVVTGATSGIGFEAARALASRGASVWVGGRSQDRSRQACAAIRDLHPDARVEPFAADLADLADVERACAALSVENLDVIIANAGLYGGGFVESAQGIERTLAVCHLAHVLLANRLLPRLRAGGGRVVAVSSDSHRSQRRLDLTRVPLTRDRYGDMAAYDLAKLCNALWSLELDRREAAYGVRSVAVHPGNLIRTQIARQSLVLKAAMWVYSPFAPSVARGAAGLVHAAVSPAMEGVGGVYLKGTRVRSASRLARDAEAAGELWEHTAELLARAGFPLR